MKPSRWSTITTTLGKHLVTNHRAVLHGSSWEHYYRRLCKHYVGEATKWMRRFRQIKRFSDAALCAFLHDYQELIIEGERNLHATEYVKAELEKLRERVALEFDAHPMDDAERGTR